jgi:transposase
MDDNSPYRQFFAQPKHPYHRQYEALRAIFVDGRSQKEVAEEFGFQYSTIRQMVYNFRRHCDTDDPSQESPFFES